MGKKNIIQSLINTKREEYPREIQYVTYHNRHTDIYWVQIGAILKYKRYGILKLHSGSHEIKIWVRNIQSLTIRIPPHIDRRLFKVVINRQTFLFSGYSREGIYFTLKDKVFHITEKLEPMKNKYKGFGLLDIYLRPARVILASDNEYMKKAAEALSSPKAYTYSNTIDIKLPILALDAFHKNADMLDFIVIDNNADKLSHLRSMMLIKTNEGGFAYLDNEYKGDYLVMQIIANPVNPEKSILYINSNKAVLYSMNMFTRKILMPPYFSKYHPYLNNDALIFFNKHYYRVVESGLPLEII